MIRFSVFLFSYAVIFYVLLYSAVNDSFRYGAGGGVYLPAYAESLSSQDKFTRINTDQSQKDGWQNIAEAILSLRNHQTKLSPSHFGHPGYEELGFLYDEAICALILNVCGYKNEAEEILDYFSNRLRISAKEVSNFADTNGVYGILKVFKPKGDLSKPVVSIINALDITSQKSEGKGRLEFYTTPGPLSFLIFAMLQVNAEKYKEEALRLGEVLLSMQGEDGGVYDGDRAPEKVHTEPHMDGYAVFLMLYKITGDRKWEKSAEAAYDWFEKNVYHSREGIIDQGIWAAKPSTIFATDVYSWTMAGPAGERIPPESLKRLTETMLNKSLVKVSLSLPDGTFKTVTLCDFSDAQDPRTKDVRGGFRPMGSVEWTGGVILALEKNAVRLYKNKDVKTAKLYKAIAEILLLEVKKCFYPLDDRKIRLSFYATAQGVEVGPFGSIEQELAKGWKTPFFYVKDTAGKELIKGGSLIGGWVIFPYSGFNPFILGDAYKQEYDEIFITEKDIAEAGDFISSIVAKSTFSETSPTEGPEVSSQLVEPEIFNQKMWKAFEYAYAAKERGDLELAGAYFTEAKQWAQRVVNNKKWKMLAIRDNLQKKREIGGIISYPWGVTYPENNHPLHKAILRYPILNEVGAAMWGLATANFELGNSQTAKYWIRRIIEDVPLHQIPDIVKDQGDPRSKIIKGYWNAIISWEDNPGGYQRDLEMGLLYREVLREKGLSTAKPKVIILSDPFFKD
jgi:tetratricopeptide (TPR) repeat protein